jgi:hypothetical protein
MMTFDLPFAPDTQGAFALSINESPPLRFSSRGAALSYAVRLANQRIAQGLDYAINVEGGDGKWRLFQGMTQLMNA